MRKPGTVFIIVRPMEPSGPPYHGSPSDFDSSVGGSVGIG